MSDETTPSFRALLEPLEIGSIAVKNRVIFGPHVNNCWPNHVADDRTIAYYEARARGGVGLIIIGASSVDGDSPYLPFSQPMMWDDGVVDGLGRVADAVHAHGCKIISQLIHPGGQYNPEGDPLHRPPVAPSQIPRVGLPWRIPVSLNREEIATIVKKFGSAAERAKRAGVDGVEIHCAHSYLLSQFITPLDNKRTDDYGGTLENRLRMPIEVLTEVRENVGQDFVVGVRMNNSDLVPGGLETDDCEEIARRFESSGLVDYLNISTGNLRSHNSIIASHYSGLASGYQGERTGRIKRRLERVPVFQIGRIHDPATAAEIVASRQADGVVMVRELIAEPDFVRKMERDDIAGIRPCVYWNHCLAKNSVGLRLECSISAGVGRELEFAESGLERAPTALRILVIGGGPAGLEFSRLAALRGHEIVLHEARDVLGGQLGYFVRLPGRGEVRGWLDWLETQLGRYDAVRIKLGARLSSENVYKVLSEEGPDAVVVATGATPAADGLSGLTGESIPGWSQDNVLTYEQALDHPERVGERVLILDEQDDRTAPGLGEYFAEKGAAVEILTKWPNVGAQMFGAVNETTFAYGRLDAAGVRITPNSWVSGIDGSMVDCYNVYSQRAWKSEADTVILVTMKHSEHEVYDSLKESGVPNLYRIGDAVAPRWIAEAVQESARLAYAL